MVSEYNKITVLLVGYKVVVHSCALFFTCFTVPKVPNYLISLAVSVLFLSDTALLKWMYITLLMYMYMYANVIHVDVHVHVVEYRSE